MYRLKYVLFFPEEQFLLFRVANVAMENYAMAVTLSRATRSLHTNAGSAQHELDICKVFCYEVSILKMTELQKFHEIVNVNSQIYRKKLENYANLFFHKSHNRRIMQS